MERKDLKKLIKSEFTSFVKDYGFWFYKPRTLLREKENVLHIINFDPGDSGFACMIAIQPLYIPLDVMSLSFGNEVTRFKAKLPQRWDYEDAETGIQLMRNLLIADAIPWFDKVGNPQGIIHFIKEILPNNPRLCMGFGPYLQYMYTGFSYLYLGQLRKADEELEKAYDLGKNDNRGWAVEENNMIISLREIARNEPNRIHEKLQEFIKHTRTNLKLGKNQQPLSF